MPETKSIALVVTELLVVIVLMPFIRASRHGDDETAAATGDALGLSPAAHESRLAGNGRVDRLSMVAVGASLPDLGVLRRAV